MIEDLFFPKVKLCNLTEISENVRFELYYVRR